jgi:UDP-2,4-diacetamido-2,4,6-trideoxy-beta-L-altropyranose hydrolase
MMNIAFRTDATRQIGTGHFMRCLTLADGLKKKGARIRFISRNLPAHLRVMLDAKGVEYLPLSTDAAQEPIDDLAHSKWLGTSQIQDAKATIQVLADHLWDWVVVDHYALDERWESTVRVSAKQLMVIDDLADRRHDCDVLLDQNFYADMQTRYSGIIPLHCQLLLGPRYALLREEFKKLRKQIKPRTGDVKKILVFFGGMDVDNYTSLAIEALVAMNNGLHVDIVIGGLHPYREQIQNSSIVHGYECHVQTTRMAELMAEADLAIGAGGSSSWERCCLGVPALLVALAENQVDIAKALDSIGACVYLGSKDKANLSILQQTMTNLLASHDQLAITSLNAFSLVDGIGVSRVCQLLRS